ncbi:MAG: LPS export ABC transporter periplasmic protein LptC [Sterolibacterium sp.]|nr:LPS export ABC transporter periplasmic protein LptC [Sterolibacterium sp.]
MRIHSAHLLPLILLTLLAALTFWLERATQAENGVSGDKLRHDPDYFVSGLVFRHFNLDGSLQSSLEAKQMLHYPDDDSTHVTEPALIFYAHAQPTRLNARSARVSEDGKLVLLTDDVRLVREASADNPELVLTTTEMQVYPDDEIARTSVPVTIVNGRSVIKGSAMEADQRAHLFTLMGRAQGTVYRKQTP